MNVRRHAQRRHVAAQRCEARARVLRMRRMLRYARGVFAKARELDAATRQALGGLDVIIAAAPPRTGQLWPPRRPGLPDREAAYATALEHARPRVPYASYGPEWGTGPFKPLTQRQADLLDDLELGT